MNSHRLNVPKPPGPHYLEELLQVYSALLSVRT